MPRVNTCRARVCMILDFVVFTHFFCKRQRKTTFFHFSILIVVIIFFNPTFQPHDDLQKIDHLVMTKSSFSLSIALCIFVFLLLYACLSRKRVGRLGLHSVLMIPHVRSLKFEVLSEEAQLERSD